MTEGFDWNARAGLTWSIDVTEFAVGDAVVAYAPGCLASHALVPAPQVRPMPPGQATPMP